MSLCSWLLMENGLSAPDNNRLLRRWFAQILVARRTSLRFAPLLLLFLLSFSLSSLNNGFLYKEAGNTIIAVSALSPRLSAHASTPTRSVGNILSKTDVRVLVADIGTQGLRRFVACWGLVGATGNGQQTTTQVGFCDVAELSLDVTVACLLFINYSPIIMYVHSYVSTNQRIFFFEKSLWFWNSRKFCRAFVFALRHIFEF